MHLGGATILATAKRCELAERTIWAAIKAYREGGWKAVHVHRGHRPRGAGRALRPEQEREIKSLIRGHTPCELDMNRVLWTRPAVAELIERRYGIRLAVRAIDEYLKRWGFTPHPPLKKAHARFPEAIAHWVHAEYPKIAKRARLEGAEIQWGCEKVLRSEDSSCRPEEALSEAPPTRSRAALRRSPAMLNNIRGDKLGLISAVTNKGKAHWKIFSGALSARIFIEFLDLLVRNSDRKIFLILYNLRVHRSKLAGDWLAEHSDTIEVFYLPNYSAAFSRITDLVPEVGSLRTRVENHGEGIPSIHELDA